jgi:hypothetical protein
MSAAAFKAAIEQGCRDEAALIALKRGQELFLRGHITKEALTALLDTAIREA